MTRTIPLGQLLTSRTIKRSEIEWPESDTYQGDLVRVRLDDAKGGDMAEWPVNLRVREVPS